MAIRTRVYPFEIVVPEVIEDIESAPKEHLELLEKTNRETMTVELPRLRCPYCDYVWVPRTPQPRRCPRCHNFIWRLELKENVKEAYLKALRDGDGP